MPQPSIPQNSSVGCLVRLFWMGAGNIILFLCVTYVFHNRVRGLALVDLAYWLTVVAMVTVRWVDIHSYHGDTVTGEPATLSHWRRYALCLVAGALVVWGIVHLLALTGGRQS
jgi:hypothetical protein